MSLWVSLPLLSKTPAMLDLRKNANPEAAFIFVLGCAVLGQPSPKDMGPAVACCKQNVTSAGSSAASGGEAQVSDI